VEQCRAVKPAFAEVGAGHSARCFRWKEVA
jgi:hypothetical protein